MTRLRIYFIIGILVLLPAILTFAQNRVIPDGMEEVQLGGSAKIIVPKGAKLKKIGAQVIVEGSKEYMSRRFAEMDDHFTKVEQNMIEMKQEIETLKDTISKIQTNAMEDSGATLVPAP